MKQVVKLLDNVEVVSAYGGDPQASKQARKMLSEAKELLGYLKIQQSE
jgi:hypothetical protein